MNGPRFVPALIAGLVLILAACGGTTSSRNAPSSPSASAAASEAESAAASEATAEGDTVSLVGFAFDPGELTVAAGTEVSFVNEDGAAHTVTEGTDGTAVADPIIDEELPADGSTSFTFDEPGTYQITCLIHPTMNMTITVE